MAESPQEGRDRYLQKTYHITLDEYNECLTSQGGGCAICGRRAKGRSLHVDHRHKSGMVSGILCWSCNRLLGVCRDNPAILRKAAEYLEEPPFVRLFGIRVAPKIVRRRKRKKS